MCMFCPDCQVIAPVRHQTTPFRRYCQVAVPGAKSAVFECILLLILCYLVRYKLHANGSGCICVKHIFVVDTALWVRRNCFLQLAFL